MIYKYYVLIILIKKYEIKVEFSLFKKKIPSIFAFWHMQHLIIFSCNHVTLTLCK